MPEARIPIKLLASLTAGFLFFKPFRQQNGKVIPPPHRHRLSAEYSDNFVRRRFPATIEAIAPAGGGVLVSAVADYVSLFRVAWFGHPVNKLLP